MSNRDLCIMACVFCRDPDFQTWVGYGHDFDELISARPPSVGRTGGEAEAKAFILSRCQVASRNDLDRDPDAAKRFHELVRKPFLEWKEANT